MGKEEPKKGDKVSWNWGGGAPGGTVAETKDEGKIAVESKRGNTIKKNASADNPAVRIERAGNDVVKRASELTVDKKAAEDGEGEGEEGHDRNGGSKRKAKNQGEPEADDEEVGAQMADAGNHDDQHTVNKQGKEVKKGGKDANKKRKTRREGDVKDKADGSRVLDDKYEGEENEGGEEDGVDDGNKTPENTKTAEAGQDT